MWWKNVITVDYSDTSSFDPWLKLTCRKGSSWTQARSMEYSDAVCGSRLKLILYHEPQHKVTESQPSQPPGFHTLHKSYRSSRDLRTTLRQLVQKRLLYVWGNFEVTVRTFDQRSGTSVTWRQAPLVACPAWEEVSGPAAAADRACPQHSWSHP